MDCSLPGSSEVWKWKLFSRVQLSVTPWTIQSIEFSKARILEWVAFPFCKGSSQPRSPTLQADSLPAEPQGKPKNTGVGSLSLLQQIFLTQNWTEVPCIAGRFFTSWATREAHMWPGNPTNLKAPLSQPLCPQNLRGDSSLWLFKYNNVFGTWAMHYLKSFLFNEMFKLTVNLNSASSSGLQISTMPAIMQNWNKATERGRKKGKGAKTITRQREP